MRSPVASLLKTATQLSPRLCVTQASVVSPGDIWLDDSGKEIQAHGGGILAPSHSNSVNTRPERISQ
jgi:hypothetical protein